MMKFKYLAGVAYLMITATTAFSGVACAGDDKSTFKAVSDMVGLTKDEGIDKINYNERAKLVMPRDSRVLPTPRDAQPKPEGWPQDASREHRRTDRYARAPGAEAEKPKPGLMERIRGPVTNTSAGTDDEPGLLQKIITNKQRAAELEPDEPQRQLLSEPPEGYRHPSVPLKEVKDTSRKNGFLGRLFGGEGNDGDPVAQTAGVNETIRKPDVDSGDKQGAAASSLTGWLPGFLKN
jgi:hypothetical protein